MTANDRKLITQLMTNKIKEDDFIERFSVNIKNEDNMISLLKDIFEKKSLDDIEYLIFLLFKFNLFSKNYVPIICKLLLQPWHRRHEDLVLALQSLKDERSIDALYKTITTRYEYLNYDDTFALAVKCIWALGDINTIKSKEKLQELTSSKNEIIKKNALKQLNRLSC